MIVYRLCSSAWKEDLSGRGAEITGGRWNSKGTAVVYTSSSRALCVAEIAVHTPLGCLPVNYCMVEIYIPDTSAIKEILPLVLPQKWQSFENRHKTQLMGDTFIQENIVLMLKVPSAVIQGDFNYLINPRHKDIRTVQIKNTEDFGFDERLF